MPFKTSGSLTTDKRTVSVSETWDTQTEWEANQSASDVSISNGVITLADAIPASAISRWTFDDADTDTGTAIDSWGSNDGTIDGATTGATGANVTYTTNESYSFDGTDDDVGIPAGLVGSSTNFSVAFWFNLNSLPSDGRFLSLRADTSLFVDIGRNGTDSLGVWTGNDNALMAGVTTGTWYHVVVTVDNSSSSVVGYVDGTEEMNTTASTTGDSNSSYIGGTDAGGNPRRIDGRIDDVRVYSKVLTSTEASDLYSTGSI